MAVIAISFACGHDLQMIDVDRVPEPHCPHCGESRMARVDAPAPRITGCASGPHVTTRALEAIPITVGRGVV